MPNPHTDLAPIIGPAPAPPVAAATPPVPWVAGFAVIVLALALAWLILRLSAPRRRLARLRRAAAGDDPQWVAQRLAKLMAARHRLHYLSPMQCPPGLDAAAWREWVVALDAVRYAAPPGDRELLMRLCRDAGDLLRRAARV